MRLRGKFREIMLKIIFAHILWYRKVNSIYHCENCTLRLLPKTIFLIICFWVAAIACGWCVEKDFSRDVYDAGERLEKLQIYFETEMYEEACLLLDELIAQFPDEPRFKYLRAVVDYQRGSYERAQEVFVEFVKEYPEVAEPYYLLGEINLKRGKEEVARQYLRRYCELVPEDYDAHLKLSSLSRKDSCATTLIKDGREDLALVKKIGFYGYGACVHSQQMQSIKLINGGFRTQSSMEIDFVYPVDLRGKQIVLKLKGKEGGEKFELTFRDKFAQDYTPQLVIAPEEKGLSGDWQQIEVGFARRQGEIDLSCVVHMGLEFGTSTAQNPRNSTLFVRDIFIEDARN